MREILQKRKTVVFFVCSFFCHFLFSFAMATRRPKNAHSIYQMAFLRCVSINGKNHVYTYVWVIPKQKWNEKIETKRNTNKSNPCITRKSVRLSSHYGHKERGNGQQHNNFNHLSKSNFCSLYFQTKWTNHSKFHNIISTDFSYEFDGSSRIHKMHSIATFQDGMVFFHDFFFSVRRFIDP